ncbi:hypothetical protein HXX01_05610, partial [Candidatus Nomurabacteria bacterium]|nr:hypothetical protein [Candidatus Nomurabacteria bacterium]
MKQPKDRRKEGPRNITVPKEKITDFSIMLIHVLKKHCQIHGNGLTHYQEKEKKGIFHIQHNDLSVIAQMKKILNEEFNIPIESIGYYGSTQDNIYMKLAEFDEKAREQVSDAFSHINSIVVKKAKAPIAGEGGSTESAEPVVKKQYTGA